MKTSRHYDHRFSGYGHWKITCEVRQEESLNPAKKKFTYTTTDSEAIDEIAGLYADQISYEDIQKFYHDRWGYSFDDEIQEWELTIMESRKYYTVQCRETGYPIEEFSTLDEAKQAIIDYEQEDREEGTYTPDFYEIIEL